MNSERKRSPCPNENERKRKYIAKVKGFKEPENYD